MSCQNYDKYLKYHYYLIGGMQLCGECALEVALDINSYKIHLKGGQNDRHKNRITN